MCMCLHKFCKKKILNIPAVQILAKTDTDGRRAFAVIGPTVWNALSNDLRDPELSFASFSRLLKTHLFQQHSAHWAH